MALVSSLLFGLFNGLLISRTSAPSLIATLGTMTFYQGIGMALTGGSSVGDLIPEFAQIGKAIFLGLPVIFWVFLDVYKRQMHRRISRTSFRFSGRRSSRCRTAAFAAFQGFIKSSLRFLYSGVSVRLHHNKIRKSVQGCRHTISEKVCFF